MLLFAIHTFPEIADKLKSFLFRPLDRFSKRVDHWLRYGGLLVPFETFNFSNDIAYVMGFFSVNDHIHPVLQQ